MPIGWDGEGCARAVCILGGGYGKAPYEFLGGPLPKKRVALRVSSGVVATRLAAMLVCWRVI